MMPILLIPLMVNMVISGAIWMGEIAFTLKVLLTIATVVEFRFLFMQHCSAKMMH